MRRTGFGSGRAAAPAPLFWTWLIAALGLIPRHSFPGRSPVASAVTLADSRLASPNSCCSGSHYFQGIPAVSNAPVGAKLAICDDYYADIDAELALAKRAQDAILRFAPKVSKFAAYSAVSLV